jgi:hypothetical protein
LLLLPAALLCQRALHACLSEEPIALEELPSSTYIVHGDGKGNGGNDSDSAVDSILKEPLQKDEAGDVLFCSALLKLQRVMPRKQHVNRRVDLQLFFLPRSVMFAGATAADREAQLRRALVSMQPVLCIRIIVTLKNVKEERCKPQQALSELKASLEREFASWHVVGMHPVLLLTVSRAPHTSAPSGSDSHTLPSVADSSLLFAPT